MNFNEVISYLISKGIEINPKDYDKVYGKLNPKDMYVIDIGADFGSTALYFLNRGADHVYMMETNPKAKEMFPLFAQEFHITGDAEYVDSVPSLTPKSYIFKCDCEGAERDYVTLDLLDKSYEFAVGIHRYLEMEDWLKIANLCIKAGATEISYIESYNSGLYGSRCEDMTFIKVVD